jgi:two-component system, sensor histidine kinase and response regulator
VIGKIIKDPIRILLVEDNLGDAHLLHSSLSSLQADYLNFTHVMNVADAIEQLKERSFDVILLDLSLPDSHGIKTVERIQQAALEIPIVVLTGLDNDEIGLQAVQAGAQDYLVKGEVDARLLVRVLRYAIERKRNEVELKEARNLALEAAWLKSEFLTNMGHELRTPMNGIMGMTGLLLDSGLNDEQRQFAEIVLSSADSLHKIINDILDYSNIELSRLKLDVCNFNLSYVVNSVIEAYSERARTKGLNLVALINKNVHTSLRGDPSRLRQILTNLIRNAVQFTDRGDIIVHISKEEETDTHELIHFTVKDTGIGISETAKHYIFRSFTQADGSLTRKYGGTGLGLALCRQVIELMGGEIGVESEEGVGSTFWFNLRFEKQPEHATPTQIEKAELKGRRVLVVDTDPKNREITVRELSLFGMKISEAEDGTNALSILREAAKQGNPFDLAIIDLQIPDMDGFDLARIIKADETITSVRLVLLPFVGKRGHGEVARQAGISAYLIRPVKHAQLTDCLEIVMSKDFESSSSNHDGFITRHTLQEIQPTQQNSILLISKSILDKKEIFSILEELGYRTDMVSNEREALEVFEGTSYRIIFADKYEAIDKIREIDKRTIIIGIVETEANKEEIEQYLKAGVNYIISKPINRNKLSEIVEKISGS